MIALVALLRYCTRVFSELYPSVLEDIRMTMPNERFTYTFANRLFSFLIICLAFGFSTSIQAQELRIDHIEPPNWWAGMQHDQVQLMVYGENLDGITAAFEDDALPVTAIHSVANASYSFIDVDLSDVSAGDYTLRITRGDETTTVPFPVHERAPLEGRNQGFSVDDVVYLITPDRFANGDPSNDRAPGLIDDFDPSQHGTRHGGDLKGIQDRLPYLADLGITAIWLNPILENNANNSYHGYQATNYYKIDPRHGGNEGYKALVAAAHEHGIKVIFDHVNNHIGSNHVWVDNLPTATWLNGSKEDHLSSKHYKMAFSDPYADPYADQLLRTFWFVSAMPDVNQRDPFVATYLIQNSIWWMEYTGLDGYREDTYPYPDQAFLADWAAAILKEYPKSNIVGEIWETAPAYLALFQKETHFDRDFETNLPTIMDFALTDAWRKYLEGTVRLNEVYKVLAQDFVYTDRNNLMTFFDNHDMARGFFISDGHVEKMKQVFTMLLTTRGIPQLLYGSEINMMGGASHIELRANMPGGFPGDTRDVFTEAGRTAMENDMFTFVRKLLYLRKKHDVLRHGRLVHYPVAWNENVYKYLRMDEDEQILVLINGETEHTKVDLTELLHWFGPDASFQDLLSGQTLEMDDNAHLTVSALGAYVLHVVR